MPIKFKCPHCHKPLSVKDHLAGKRAKCPACQQPITIPAPTAAPADVEDLAASALKDEPAVAAAKKEAATIDFTCVYCDAELHLPADLGGKQTPCPECRRIIKVPLPAKADTTDWRTVQVRGPSGAKQAVEQQAPEGAWGSASRPGTVSREALEEAGAITEEREPITVGGWIRRGVLAAGVLAVLIVGFIFLKKLWTHPLDEQALSLARAQVEDPKSKLPPEWTGEVHRAMGEYHLKANKPEDARTAFRKARSIAQKPPGSPHDRDAFLIELALTQLGLGGTPQQIKDGARLDWETAAKEAQQTLRLIVLPEARHEGVRRVCLALLTKGQASYIGGIKNLEDLPAGLPAQGANKRKKPPLVALLLALLEPDSAKLVLPPPADKMTLEQADLSTRCLYQSDWVPKHQLAAVRQFLVGDPAQKDPLGDRLECLLVVATVAQQKGEAEEAGRCLDAAVGLIAKPPKDQRASPWLRSDWALFAVQVGRNDRAEALIKELKNHPDLQGRILLEQYSLKAQGEGDLSADSWKQAVPDAKTLAHAQALEVYARTRTRHGDGPAVLSAVEEMKPETVRPLGYVGVALGVQDKG